MPEDKKTQSSEETSKTHVTLTFDRPITEEELKQMQLQHKAISAAKASGGHHDHDHPKLF